MMDTADDASIVVAALNSDACLAAREAFAGSRRRRARAADVAPRDQRARTLGRVAET